MERLDDRVPSTKEREYVGARMGGIPVLLGGVFLSLLGVGDSGKGAGKDGGRNTWDVRSMYRR